MILTYNDIYKKAYGAPSSMFATTFHAIFRQVESQASSDLRGTFSTVDAHSNIDTVRIHVDSVVAADTYHNSIIKT